MPNFESLSRVLNLPTPAPQQAAPPPAPMPMPVPPPQAEAPAPQGFLDNQASFEKKGGLPIKIIASIQKVYQGPEPQINAQGGPAATTGGLKPGWGGRGR